MQKKFSTKTLTLYAVFIALTLFLGLTPLGIIPLGFINVTILCIPVIVGTLTLGLGAGVLFGAFFGLASLMSALGLSLTQPSALAGMLLAQSPALLVAMCFVPRLLVPVTTYAVHAALSRKSGGAKAIFPAAITGSLTNTVLYLGLMLLFFSITGLDQAPVLAVIGGTGLIAGGLEAAAAGIIATPVVLALAKMRK